MAKSLGVRTIFKATVKTAVLVDGGFFIKSYRRHYPGGTGHTPEQAARNMHRMALDHANYDDGELYRIFYYDCAPFAKKVHNPVSGKLVDFSKTPIYEFQVRFLEELKRLRKVATRLGELHDSHNWGIHPRTLKDLLSGKRQMDSLTEDDVFYELKQKGVDIKVGLDIASMAYKRLVGRVVLVSGDSDFVSAARLARREGIDFILDPMRNHVKPSLFEHIDGLRTTVPVKPKPKSKPQAAPKRKTS